MWKIMIGVSCGAFLLITAISLLFICRNPAVETMGPWRPGLSRQLQKAFITGIPQLDWTDLETACEDFSNIIETMEGCTLFKGTLSSGVEICVAATTITRLKDWSKHAEFGFRKKVADLSFWREFYPKVKISGANESTHSVLPPLADKEANVYSFVVLLLEIIFGKHPYLDEQEPLVTWAEQYLNDKQSISHMIDPTLKSFKQNELEVVCKVIQDCIQKDASRRPTINEIIPKLREVLGISPEQATPRLSPLWWAELESLSAEAP